MPFPKIAALEMPILQELSATGGTEDVRFLYDRLTAYFPQLEDGETRATGGAARENWRKLVQKAGRELDDKNLIRRERGFWTLTEKGKRTAADETEGFQLSRGGEIVELNHKQIQAMLVEIGVWLGYDAETEFEYYDVIWRERRGAARLSHVFEVQSKGNIDSAFAKLKRAYDAQRTKPFLVISTERDTNRAKQSLEREFRELTDFLTIISFAEMQSVHQNLQTIAKILPKFLEK